MNQELKRHLRKLAWYAWLWFPFMIVAASSGFLFLVFLIGEPAWSVYFLPSFFLSLLVCLLLHFLNKRYCKTVSLSPVVLTLSEPYGYDKVLHTLRQHCGEYATMSYSEDAFFCVTNDPAVIRIVAIRYQDFDKKNFDEQRRQINRKVNQHYKGDAWTQSVGVYLNLICTDHMNDSLRKLLSKNAVYNLNHKGFGIVNVAIIGNQIYLPPLNGELLLGCISRYKAPIRLFEKLFPLS